MTNLTNAMHRDAPRPVRVIAGLLVNLIVLPGLGTLVGGDLQRRRVGWLQLGLCVILAPTVALITARGWAPFGVSTESVRTGMASMMMVLALWSASTSVFGIWDAWKADRRGNRV
ncbi:hypothetical protein WDW37_11090 [Bdellovibrionota bacterium FG-1]